jgi:hypothetical protein
VAGAIVFWLFHFVEYFYQALADGLFYQLVAVMKPRLFIALIPEGDSQLVKPSAWWCVSF